ncbi:MAG: diguanylate cyclase [Calditrichaeota bacterium]|nr:diguanylate cyclase [Calditrichota bacterium]
MEKKAYKVLYIEDDYASRLLIRKILRSGEFDVHEASTGMEGLKKAQELQPDIILMDLNLPDISGTNLTTKIKSMPELKDTVVVAITARNSVEARQLSLIAGCHGYISKPIDPHTFPDQIRQFLRGKREEIEFEKRDYYHQLYEEALVNNLTIKLQELQRSNSLLKQRTSTLKDYSRKLEKLLTIINDLQLCHSSEKLKEKLIDYLCELFAFDRCLFLDVDFENLTLKVAVGRGLEKSRWENFHLPFQTQLFRRLFKERQILPNLTIQQIENPQIRQLLEELGSQHFTLAILGIPADAAIQMSSKENLKEFMKPFLTTLTATADIDVQNIEDHLREFLLSEVFYIGGYLFMDYTHPTKKLSSHDLRILDMLLRTSTLIYQNLQLREHLKKLFIRAEKDAITDYLTNLYNHRYFIQQLSREFNRARRHNSQFALIMIDIDHFKDFNDTFGHQAGDLVLQKIGRILRENTRKSDIAARYGGEEFAIICPELNKRRGQILAEKLRKIIEGTRLPFSQDTRITISAGVAAFPEDADNPQDLIRCADVALYEAKRKGRNRVQAFSPALQTTP